MNTEVSTERAEKLSEPPASHVRQSSNERSSDDGRGGESAGGGAPSHDAPRHTATVLVRGETLADQALVDQTLVDQTLVDQQPKPAPADSPPPGQQDTAQQDTAQQDKGQESKGPEHKAAEKSERKEVSEAKIKLQNLLPVLEDDPDVGVAKEQIVIRDGKADLAFTGTLLASAAPPSAPKGHWREYRIYATNGGKHVFSKVARSVFADERDTHEAEIFDPAPSSVPSQLLRSARDLARSRPLTWMDAAVAFFGYDPLAKALYRKVSGQFEEHIS